MRKRGKNVVIVATEAPRYTETAIHFDVAELPRLLRAHLPPGPLAYADFGCGDGPLFAALERGGFVVAGTPVYAVDLEAARLARVRERFPYVTTLVGPADSAPGIPAGTLDFVSSTMVMEHVPDERKYLDEICRVLRPGGRAYITTVFKKPWAWYFRKRDGESVLDSSHLREYTDLAAFKALLMEGGRFAVLRALELEPLWFPLLDPILFRLAGRGGPLDGRVVRRALRAAKVPIPGYFSLNVVVGR